MSATGVSTKSAPTLAVAFAVIALAVAACDRQDSSLFVEQSTVVKAPAIPVQNYVGRWAVTPANCAAHPWTFDKISLAAGDGTVCQIASAERSPAGYSLPGICKRPDGELPGRLLLTFAGVDSMTLTGGPYKNPVTLVRCSAQG